MLAYRCSPLNVSQRDIFRQRCYFHHGQHSSHSHRSQPARPDPEQPGKALVEWVAERGLPPYRAGQMLRRLWQAPVESWEQATDLPAALRAELDLTFPLPRLAPDTIQQSADGTRKYLWRLSDGEAIESVLIPSGSRRTLCISSQAGCALGCSLLRHRPDGLPAQPDARSRSPDRSGRSCSTNPEEKPTNIVFMGMGEPLLNWPAVDATLSILNHPDGLGIGARHITVSTVGILPGMAEFAKRPEQFRLAISLHATTSAQRLAIMPIEKKYDLEAVLKAAEAFRKRVTFEYVMIGGVNDSDADADQLGKLGPPAGRAGEHPAAASGRRAGSHPTPGQPRIRAFSERLRNQG